MKCTVHILIPLEFIWQGLTGDILALYRSWAFVECKNYTENGGIFAIRTRHLALVSGSRPLDALFANSSLPDSTGYGLASPRVPASPSHPFSGGGGTDGEQRVEKQSQPKQSGRGKGLPVKDPLIGKTVRIIQGDMKGYVGIVKEATVITVRVELHSNCKILKLDRARVQPVDTPSRAPGSVHAKTPGGTSVYGGGKTPSYGYGGRTPMYGAGAMTPMHDGSRTPAYDGGGRTPRPDGSMTPGPWDAAATPARHTEYDIEESDLNPGIGLRICSVLILVIELDASAHAVCVLYLRPTYSTVVSCLL